MTENFASLQKTFPQKVTKYSLLTSLSVFFKFSGNKIINSISFANVGIVAISSFVFAFFTAVITNEVSHRASYDWVWTLTDRKLSVSTSTPRAHMGCIFIHFSHGINGNGFM